MAEWVNIPHSIWEYILELLDDDTWRGQHLSSVSRPWQLIMVDGVIQRRRQGMIVLTPQRIPREHLQPNFGKTFAAIVGLITHFEIHNISNDHYQFVDPPQNIRSFKAISNEGLGLILLQLMRNVGQRLQYNNVTALDLTDDHESAVDDNVYQPAEMVQIDLFVPPLSLPPSNGGSFANYLFHWFFPNVTSVNLSRTTWDNTATTEISFAQIKQLIWRSSCILTDSFLSPLLVSTQLVDLQLNNSTILLPWTEQAHPVHWRNVGADGDFPYNVFC